MNFLFKLINMMEFFKSWKQGSFREIFGGWRKCRCLASSCDKQHGNQNDTQMEYWLLVSSWRSYLWTNSESLMEEKMNSHFLFSSNIQGYFIRHEKDITYIEQPKVVEVCDTFSVDQHLCNLIIGANLSHCKEHYDCITQSNIY